MSSSICPHFTQNAWKKDLCSNCFKSKDEHKASNTTSYLSKYTSIADRSKHITNSLVSKTEFDTTKKTEYPNKHKTPIKSIMKKSFSLPSKSHKHKTHRVSFPKSLYEVIGVGGEWSDNDSDDDDDHDFMNIGNERDDNAATSTDDEETLELKRITRANTDFNMNNGNLLGDAQENIKRSFAALKLGAPQVDKEGKKQTLKINVMPFGAAATGDSVKSATVATATTVKAKFETKTDSAEMKCESKITKQNVTVVKSTKKTTTTSTAAATPNGTPLTMTNATMVATSATTTATATTTKTTKSVSTYSASSLSATAAKHGDASASDSDGKNSPPIERAMEKSLLDEISETLEKKQSECKKLAAEKEVSATAACTNATAAAKIKFEISSLSDASESKPFLELKKPIARNPPITKDQTKPKINVFHKYPDSDSNSNCSDNENGISAYYDVFETQISYENLPDGKCDAKDKPAATVAPTAAAINSNVKGKPDNSIYSSSQYITDMLLSSKTRAASYNLHEGNFMTSKITSDGLIVTKCSSDDALDSTGSSFDGSSDEETSYNMIRSESDSGIGISIGSEYKNVCTDKEREHVRAEKKLSVSTNNSDYEDIQVANQATNAAVTLKSAKAQAKATFLLEKSRELHGEPDGSADPDGSLENKETNAAQQLPALPKSPPPTKLIDARPSFLHGLQKQHPQILLKKPDLPAKPVVSPTASPLKTFVPKRNPTNVEQQVINQLQMVMSKSNENLNLSTAAESAKDDAKLKKGRAPNPPPDQKSSAPPTPERDYNVTMEFAEQGRKEAEAANYTAAKKATEEQQLSAKPQATPVIKSSADGELKKSNERAEVDKLNTPTLTAPSTATTTATAATEQTAAASIYTRKVPATTPNATNNGLKNVSSPVIREKDKRERATVNPKFRSLNTFVTQRSNALKNMQLQTATSSLSLKQTSSLTPEPMPKNHKNLSLSEECLAEVTHTNNSTNNNNAIYSTPSVNLSAMSGGDKKSPSQLQQQPTTQKTKTKFSIKKFLRMGASKTTDNLHKKDSIYSEICTGEEAGVVGKPRLVIIHPIDINPTAVEVVKDITKTSDPVTAQTVAVVTAKPPAPPLRSTDGQRTHELHKPARPPPPKSAELRRKQQIGLSMSLADGRTGFAAGEAGGSMKCKSDNVYANLGEIRSSIAPRKPERTASMREREAQLELARKRHAGARNENADTVSICSSNGDNVSMEHASSHPNGAMGASNNSNISKRSNSALGSQQYAAAAHGSGERANTPTTTATVNATMVDGKPPMGNRTSTFERRKSDPKIAIANKLEIFENRTNSPNSNNNQNNNNGSSSHAHGNNGTNAPELVVRPSSLKDSVRKINSTIDSYLKDKRDYDNMYELVKGASSPPPPPTRTVDLMAGGQRLLPPRRNNSNNNNNNNNNIYADTMSVASYTRSEYGPVRNYGLNSSLANIPRIISASYCGSEVGEFEIYSPYSYYGSEAGGDVATDINDSVWGIPSTIKQRAKATNRLRMRKGRSVVHKTIEDNYTAVVVANHEALAQVLDQLQQTPIIPPALRPLANAMNLRFEDFTILDGAQAFVVGKKAFHAALWTTAPVTLALSADCNQLSGVGGELNQLSGGVSGVLNPITEFCDLVPSYHLPLMPSTAVTLLQATISVLPRLQLDTLQSIGGILKGKSHVLDKSNFNFRGSIPNLAGLKDSNNTCAANALRNVVSVQNLSTLNEESLEKCGAQSEHACTDATPSCAAGGGGGGGGMPAFDDVMTREVAFIMLQLVNGMKNLQVKAIEEMPRSLSNVVLSKDVENKDAQARLCVLQCSNSDEDEAMGTLCKCAHIALTELLPHTKITPIVRDILAQERAESLSKSKSVLEFVLWGPSDVVLSGSTKERELALQRWLDLERATVLHGLVRTRIELTVYDECHLMFLVRSTAKMMNDAAKIVCSYQQTTTATEQLQQQQPE